VNDINLRHIKAFMAVAQTGRVSHGAAHILRAQSAVTRSVLELESSLGVRLFERSPAGMALTVFGEALLARGRRSADQFALAAQEMSEMLGRSISPGAPLFSMQVSVKRLEALVVLTELHNMPAAARRVGVTQPAISAAIREIEDSLGTALFERTPRGLLPGRPALALAARVRLAMNELHQAVEEISALQGVMSGSVRVGATPFGRTAILPRAVARLLRSHPLVRVSVTEGPFDTLAVDLRAGRLDMIVAALRPFPPGSDLCGEVLLEDQLSLIVRAGHPLTRQRPLSIKDLRDASWVLARPSTPTRQLFERAWQAYFDRPPRVVTETSSLAMNRGLLMESDAITALSRHEVELELRFGMLAMLPIELPELRHHIGLIQREAAMPAPAAEALMQTIRETVANLDPEDPVEDPTVP
jgi:LysR family transcriptional regulator, regulator for genes of the gallate degradation pathway